MQGPTPQMPENTTRRVISPFVRAPWVTTTPALGSQRRPTRPLPTASRPCAACCSRRAFAGSTFARACGWRRRSRTAPSPRTRPTRREWPGSRLAGWTGATARACRLRAHHPVGTDAGSASLYAEPSAPAGATPTDTSERGGSLSADVIRTVVRANQRHIPCCDRTRTLVRNARHRDGALHHPTRRHGLDGHRGQRHRRRCRTPRVHHRVGRDVAVRPCGRRW